MALQADLGSFASSARSDRNTWEDLAQLEQSTSQARWLWEEAMRAREKALVDTLTELTNRRGFELAPTTCANPAHQADSY